ncbi:MAG: hypothetical protein HC895_07860 [Leptolyngbyaceae cyanobacterium SM1_3_5]|nr:hypothetical protein [Leptolyngbyaceae cyanobacterium SM1_3_5]
MDIYRSTLRPLLFRSQADPEWLHQQTIAALNTLSTQDWLARSVARSCSFAHSSLKQTLWGLNFANSVGLAAGFDKDGLAAGAWASLGFGFAELGTVTHLPQTYLDGAALLLPDGTPVVALTLRYDRIDNFWFVLLHELGHILLPAGPRRVSPHEPGGLRRQEAD